MNRVIPLASIFAVILSSTRADHSCYYPNGDLASGDFPCYNLADNSSQSFCCAKGYACLTNSICFNTQSTGSEPKWNRGSCTDKTFGSGSCPDFCKNNHPDGGSWVVDCGMVDANNAAAGNVACCTNSSTSSDCCNDFSQKFTLSGIASSTITIIGAAATTFSSAKTTTSGTSTTSSASTTTAGSSAATSSPQSTAGSGSSGISGGAIAGVVIGIVAAVALLGFGIFLFRRNRLRKTAHTDHAAELPPTYAPAAAHYSDAVYAKHAPMEAPMEAPVEVPVQEKPAELEAVERK